MLDIPTFCVVVNDVNAFWKRTVFDVHAPFAVNVFKFGTATGKRTSVANTFEFCISFVVASYISIVAPDGVV